MSVDENELLESWEKKDYEYGFVTDIESETFPPGLDEDVIKRLSAIKEEPSFMLEWRLKAFEKWKQMENPDWAFLKVQPIDYQAISYYSAPSSLPKYESLDEVDPKLLETYDKLGIPLEEQKRLAGVAVDAVFDSVSVATTYKEELEKHGIIFCPMSEALKNHPELVKKYYGSVVPPTDNVLACSIQSSRAIRPGKERKFSTQAVLSFDQSEI